MKMTTYDMKLAASTCVNTPQSHKIKPLALTVQIVNLKIRSELDTPSQFSAVTGLPATFTLTVR
jgi:hypothetical protein